MHTNFIVKYNGTMVDLAKDVANLRYDTLANFLLDLRTEIVAQAHIDSNEGRAILARQLTELQHYLLKAHTATELAWKISKLYMTMNN